MPLSNKPVSASFSLGYPAHSCCKPSGFERPSYFAGHLLTDADLTLEQRYHREKNKLQNRTLHGEGIVCGLRLTCDQNNPRRVLVGKGYALDSQGNDLVVAEAISFDVVGLLIEKGLIFLDPPLDPSRREHPAPEHVSPEVNLSRRFYISLSYHEEKVDLVVPLGDGGASAPSDYEPTRVREMICLDVSDAKPEKLDPSDAIKRRLGACFSLFSEGAFAQALRSHRRVLNDLATAEGRTEHNYQKIFHELQGHLLLYLRKHTDKYNPTLPEQIRNVRFPFVQQSGERVPTNNVEEIRESFSSLLALAWQHAVDSAFGEIVPPDPDPLEASGVLLGTVMIGNGRVMQVCNGPRSYICTTANFPNGLMAMTLGAVACREEDERDPESDPTDTIGYRKSNFDLECFLRWFSVSPKASFYAGTEFLRLIDTIKKSIQEGFDFTNSCNFSTRMFEQLNVADAEGHLRDAGVPFRVKAAPLDQIAPPLVAVLQAAGLASGNEPIVLEVNEGSVSSAGVRHADLVARIQHLQNQIDGLKAQMERRE